MNDIVSLGNLLVGGGVSTVLTVLFGGLFQRRMRQADYTAAMVETAGNFAERVDKRSQQLEERLGQFETKVDRLDDRVDELSDLLRVAIPLLISAGHDALAAQMRDALARPVM